MNANALAASRLAHHRSRKRINALALVLSLGAMAFGVFWLMWILFETFRLGIGGIALATFTQMTPPPQAETGGLANAIFGSVAMVSLATLLGTPIEFRDQSLYYRSKTVLEVSQTLIQMGRPEMTLVAVLVILFSVVFPALKMLALGACLFRPALLRTSRIVKLLAFELSKWSMADVMALAIFMSFVAFNGVIGSAWDGLRDVPNVQQVLIPTNASKILPGYYLFIGFCVSSIFLSRKLGHGIASHSSSESS